MRYPHTFKLIVASGFLFLLVVGTTYAVADAYSGLTSDDMGANPNAPASATVAPNNHLGQSPVASTPTAPTAASRPASWPGQIPEYPDTGKKPIPWLELIRGTNPPPANSTAQPAQAGSPVNRPIITQQIAPIQYKRCEEVQTVARVGTEVILAGDVMAIFVNEKLEELNEPIPDKYRDRIMISFLPRAIINKLMFLEAKRTIPEENLAMVQSKVRTFFYQKSVPKLMKRAKVDSIKALDERLTELGSSLQWQERIFFEQALGQSWMGDEVKFDSPVNYEEMITYYREHATDYDHPTRIRWEEIMVRFDNYPTREAAFQKIAQLGNQVIGGMPFAEVARRSSDGPTASDGGQRDWITQGVLVSEQIDTALFGINGKYAGLPKGQLSRILESPSGYHIVRVVERENAYRTSFADVQDDIRKAIQKHREAEQSKAYLVKLRENTNIWTVYDEAIARRDDKKSDNSIKRR